MAVRAKREVIDRFYDSEYGGIYWSIDPSGHPLDTKKQFYALGFAIYGLSEFARATGDEEAKEYAVRLFHDIEAHSRDRERGGYVEALTRDWQPIADVRLSGKDRNANKTMNTHLHIIEPYVNLLRVWNSPELREAIRGLLEVFADKIIRPERGWHLGLFFDDDWREIDPGTVSYGHDIEASWLLLEAATEHGDRALYEKYLDITGRVADAALEGVGADGAMIYERFPDGRIDGDYHWWVQAENVVGQLFLYLYHGRKDMAAAAFKSWNFIRKNLVDDNGEWFWSISEGKPSRSEDKAGFWKCPYHNSRMCLEILSRC